MVEHEIELIVVLLLVVVALATIAMRIQVPYPMLLLAGGIVVALIPGMPEISLNPDLGLVIFLAPVIFDAAYSTSWRDFRNNARPIGILAIGAVLKTMVIAGIVARQVFPGMSWPVALTLGAIVSPPDAVAATAIFDRLGVPYRMRTILEGESLVNDASALVAYRFAVAAVVTGVFSLRDFSTQFIVIGVGGTAAGLVAGWLLVRLESFIEDASLEIAATLVAPSAIYILANRAQVSGVLAVVAAGLYFGHHSTRSLSTRSRLGGFRVWQTGLIVINGLVFILIGLQLKNILHNVGHGSSGRLFAQALAISGAVVLARFLWVFASAFLYDAVARRHGGARQTLPWRWRIVIAWSGLRGVVSLVSAVALPLTLDHGERFPFRNEIVFSSFIVIVVTLLGQGLSLPWILRRLQIHDDGRIEREVWEGRRIAFEAGIARLDALSGEPWVPKDDAALMKQQFQHILACIPASRNESDIDGSHLEAIERLRNDVIDAARLAVLAARDAETIGDDARLQVEADLDLELLTFRI